MKFCPQCGTPFEPGSRFCLECGFDIHSVEPEIQETTDPTPAGEISLPEAVPLPEKNCRQCGNPLGPEERFCGQCGADNALPAVEPSVVPEVPEPAPQAEVAQDPVPVNARPAGDSGGFCEQCGSPLSEGTIFCEQCGHKTVEETGTEYPPVQEQSASATPPPVAPPPTPPVEKSDEKSNPAQPGGQVYPTDKKRNKRFLVPLLIVAAIIVLGAGGWYVWDNYLGKPGEPVADTTTLAVAPQTESGDDQLMGDTLQPTEVPVEEPAVKEPVKEPVKPAGNKQNTQKKTPPAKKATEPKKTEPQSSEPPQSNEPVKVKIKPAGVKAGKVLLSIYNDEEVKSGPLFASKLKLDQAFIITRITTYHYNWGKGFQPGTIWLQKKKETFGPWQARAAPGDDGTPNGKWICEPNIRLEEGTYKVNVSEDKTWSYNSKSGQKGFVVIEGYEAE